MLFDFSWTTLTCERLPPPSPPTALHTGVRLPEWARCWANMSSVVRALDPVNLPTRPPAVMCLWLNDLKRMCTRHAPPGFHSLCRAIDPLVCRFGRRVNRNSMWPAPPYSFPRSSRHSTTLCAVFSEVCGPCCPCLLPIMHATPVAAMPATQRVLHSQQFTLYNVARRTISHLRTRTASSPCRTTNRIHTRCVAPTATLSCSCAMRYS